MTKLNNPLELSDALTIWGNGQLFAFSGLDGATDFRSGIVAQSSEDGLLFRAPRLAKLKTAQVISAEFGVDWGNLDTRAGLVRFCFLDAHHIVVEGPVSFEELEDEYTAFKFVRKENGCVLSAIGHAAQVSFSMDELQGLRRNWVQSNTNLINGDHQSLGRKALQQMKGMVYAPEGQLAFHTATPDRYPHREIWLWDSVFHAVGYRHLDVQLSQDMLSAVFAAQLDNGQIPISFGAYATRIHRTQPPILAWGVSQIVEIVTDPDWVAHLLPKLRKYLMWFENNRMLDGLFGWVEDNGALGSVCDESGMDNSPRFQGNANLQAVDLCCYMAQEYQAMAKLDPAGDWAQRAENLRADIDAKLWDTDLGFYCDYDPQTGRSTGVEAVTGFLPLVLGGMDQTKTHALAAAAQDPSRFGTAFPLPSIAVSHPGYAKDMWQGPVWINMNWMIARGFAKCGQVDLAATIRQRTLDEMQTCYHATGSIFEYYDDAAQVAPPQLLRKGKCDPVIDPKHPSIHLVIHDYGWSATLALDWIIRGTV